MLETRVEESNPLGPAINSEVIREFVRRSVSCSFGLQLRQCELRSIKVNRTRRRVIA